MFGTSSAAYCRSTTLSQAWVMAWHPDDGLRFERLVSCYTKALANSPFSSLAVIPFHLQPYNNIEPNNPTTVATRSSLFVNHFATYSTN